MQRDFSKFIILLLLLAVFFAMVTQRLMLTSEGSEQQAADNLRSGHGQSMNKLPPRNTLKELKNKVIKMEQYVQQQNVTIPAFLKYFLPDINETVSQPAAEAPAPKPIVNTKPIVANKPVEAVVPANPATVAAVAKKNQTQPAVAKPPPKSVQATQAAAASHLQDLQVEKKDNILPPISAIEVQQHEDQRKKDRLMHRQNMTQIAANKPNATKPIDQPPKPAPKTETKAVVPATKAGEVKAAGKPAVTKNHKMKDKIQSLQEPVRHRNHPDVSPRPGTDISTLTHQHALINCRNQSSCIVPTLQLVPRLKVYFCSRPVRRGVRFYYLVNEGLLNHPNVDLLPPDRIEEADLIFYLPASAPWHLTECNNTNFKSRLIVLEEFDGATLFEPFRKHEEVVAAYGPSLDWYLMYFKRSFVGRKDGVFTGYPHHTQREMYPIVYSIAELYIPQTFNSQREIDILCTLRGHAAMSTRLRVQTWVSEYVHNNSISTAIVGELNTGTRTDVSQTYFQQMYNSKIIVTVNPANWEGDFRLWEAMASGALVFCDPVFVPHAFPLLHKKHLIYFDNNNVTDLTSKLDYYLAHPQEAREIAVNGYLYAMKYHRSVSMVDYFLYSAHVKLSQSNPAKYGNAERYQFTAQYLHREMLRQREQIKAKQVPGDYLTGY